MLVRFLGFVFSAVAMLCLAGAIVVAGAVWYYGKDLPDHQQLADYRPPQSSLVLDDDGGVIARFARQERQFVPIEDIPPLVRQAFISAEDKNFYDHNGIDPIGIAKAMVRNVNALRNGGRMSGASTITQQVVKNMLLSNERSVSRKVREAVLAMRIERELSKDRILEIYLNQIYLGARSYGVGAASRTYFGKKLRYLEPEEAAYLAALPKAPSVLHPVRNTDAAIARRNYVLDEMRENGFLDDDTVVAAMEKPLKTRLNDTRRSEESYDWASAFMIEEVRGLMLDWFQENGELSGQEGENVQERAENALYGGGLTIRTTLDGELQDYASDALRYGLHRYERARGYRGPIGKADPDGDWREEITETFYPRDLGDWNLGVVLNLRGEEDEALIGVEGRDKAVTVSLDAVRWARRRDADGNRGPKVEKIADVFERGDVVYVVEGSKLVEGDVVALAPGESGGEDAVWGLRQLPEANGAVVALEPDTGRVLAMQGGISAQQSYFNRVTQAERQPGSSFKPVIYAAAMENGYTPATIVLDAPVTVDQGNNEGLWKPSNYREGAFYGPTPLRVGLEKSRNLMTVRIAQDIGMDTIADYARRLGIYDDMPQLLSYSLGSGETTLMRMAAAYSMFVNGGRHVTPRFVEAVKDVAGDPLDLGVAWQVPEDPGEPEQVLDPVTAFQTVSLMEGVVLRGTATKLTRLGFPVAGKTGTTNEARDAWFVGFTPDLVFGCYIGFDTPRSLGRRASGGGVCGPVFERFMRHAMTDRSPKKFAVPEGVELIKIDRTSGQRVGGDVFGKNVIWEAFRAGTGPELAALTDRGDEAGSFIPDPSMQPEIGPGIGAPPPVQPNAPVGAIDSLPVEPLIQFDPVTGQMIVAPDPAIRVEPSPDIVYRPSNPSPNQPYGTTGAPPLANNTAPLPSMLGNSAEDLQGGRGLY